MSFSSEYQKLRKKRLEEAEKKADSQAQNKTFTDTYNDLRNERLSEESLRDVNTDSKIMLTNFADRNLPLYDKDSWRNALSKMQEESDTFHANMKAKYGTLEERKKKEEENTWFTAGAFDDGYDFGDITKTILGTGTELVDNAVAGVAEMGENVVDFGATVVGGVGGLFSDEFQKDVEDFIAGDLIDSDAVGDVVGYVNPLKWGNELINGGDAEANSILGEKSEGLTQSLAQLAVTAALGGVVPWWLTTGVTSFGAEMDNALNQGATFGEATISSAISASAEILTEKLFGGSGLGEKGLINLDGLTKGISNKIVKTLADYGVDMASEGVEEVISSVASRAGSALYKEENVLELLTNEEALEEYLDSFIGGVALSGVMNVSKVNKSIKTERDYRTGLTSNEQKVFDKEYEKRVSDAGENLSKKEKAKIYDDVMSDLKKGFISTDTIEEVLGEDTYKAYKDAVANEDAIKKEYADLGSKEYLDPAEYERYTELGKLIEETDSKQLKAEADKSFAELLKKDTYLQNSYAERVRRSQKFDADLSQYTDENAKKTVENAIKYGMHNGTDAHEFVDFAAKLAAKKGYVVDFTNTRMLKDSIANGNEYNLEAGAERVEAFVSESKKKIVLNMDAEKSRSSLFGHEITHTLETAGAYDKAQKYIFEYAKQKGEYDSRLSDIESRYSKVTADVQKELTADLSGDYLLTDYDFIQQLASKDRNVFQKVYDEIKYMFKLATTGSKEARALEKAKHYYEKALREATKAETKGEGNKYSLSDSDGKKLTKEQSEYFKDSKMRDEEGNLKVMYHGSQDAGFHVFDPNMSDDDTSFFFVDRNDVAASYSGTTETYEAQTIRTAEDMNNFIESIGVEGYEVVEQSGQFILLYEGDRVAASDTAQGIYEEFCWYEGVGEGDANYKVYLNLTNPLEIDAEGRNWNNVSREYSQELADRYGTLTAEEKAALTDLAEWGDINIFRYNIYDAFMNAETGVQKQTLPGLDESPVDDENAKLIASAYAKLGADKCNMYDLFSIASDNFSEDSINQFAVKQMNTRDYAKKAKAEGYDGVIFKNIHDNGGYSNGSEGASTVAIAFNSEQIKSVANATPTSDPDIRYSLSAETDKQYLDAVNRGDTETAQKIVSDVAKEAMPNSKLRTPDGNLRVVYHGTNTGDFTVFNPDYIGMSSGDDGFFGMGFYFAYSKGEASYYGAKRVIPAYLNLTNPFDFERELQTYKGKKASAGYAPDAVALMNFADKFPDIAKDVEIEVVMKGDDLYRSISLKEFSEAFKDVINNKTFDYQELTNEYGEAETLVVADPTTHEYEWNGEKHTYNDYGFQKRWWGKPNDLDVAYEYLSNSVYSAVDMIPRTRLILDNNRAFTDALKARGYDGAIQSEYGDEAVAFDPSQIKLADAVTYDDQGNVIPLTERFNASNNDIRYSLSAETDKNYLDAVNRGDTAAAQKMVDKAAETAGYTIKAYHGTPNTEFTVFDKERLGKGNDQYGAGFYFTTDKTGATHYGNRVIDAVLDIKNPIRFTATTESGRNLIDADVELTSKQAYEVVKRLPGIYDAEESPLGDYFDAYWEVGAKDWMIRELAEQYRDVGYLDSDLFRNYPNELHEALRDVVGYDGVEVTFESTGEKFYVAWFDNQMKSADPVTYDDNGNVIPLSERFNTGNNDIRHSLARGAEKTYGNYNGKLRDLVLAPTAEDVAPVAKKAVDDSATAEQTAVTTARENLANITEDEMPPEPIAPYVPEKETVTVDDKPLGTITQKVNEILGLDAEDSAKMADIIREYAKDERFTERDLHEVIRDNFRYTEEMENDADEISQAKQHMRGVTLYIDPDYKGDFHGKNKDGYNAFRREHFGHFYLTTKPTSYALSVDSFYEELSEYFPSLFPADIGNVADRLQRMGEVADMKPETVSRSMEYDDETIQSVVDVIKNELTQYSQGETLRLLNESKSAFYKSVQAKDIAPSAEYLDENGQVNLFANEAEDPAEKEVLRINNRVDQERARLSAELQQKKAQAQAIADNKDAFISKKASELYEELRNLKKGVRASKDLGYLLDHGYEWSAVKAALVNIKHTPGKRVNQNSAIESIAREMINGYYEDAVYRLDELDAEYQDKVAKLEAGAESQRQQARAAAQQTETAEGSESAARTRKDLHQEKIDEIYAAFAEKGYNFQDVLKNAKNLSTFRTVDNTPQRAMEKSLGYNEGQILADKTVNKAAQNESDGIKWLNSFTDRKNGLLAKISKQYHIKPGSIENAAAQMFAEGFYVNDKGEYVKYGAEELEKDFPDANVRANIIGLAGDQRIRQIYDDTLKAINESRARNLYPEIPRLENYFLHFRAMEDTFSRIGLPFNPNDIRAKDLPTDLNGVTADLKPGQPYFASAMHRMGKKTTYDLLGGLERYLSSAKNQIYHIDDIQTLRALRNHIAETYGQASGLDGLDLLTESEAEERIKEVFDAHLSTFAKFLNEEANVLAGKTALIDRGIEGIIGRRGMMFVDTVNKQVGSNMVGYNVSSSLTNLLAGVQAIAKTNKASAVKAFAQTTASKFGSIFGNENTFAENDPFLIRRKGAERFHRTPFQKIGDAGYFLASAVDNVTSEFVVRAKYNEFIKNGMSQQQAIEEADKWAARLMGDRSLGQMPHLYNSKMLGLVTKFQLEVRNQLDSQFYDTVKEAKASNKDTQSGLLRNSKIAAKVTKTLFELAVLQHVFGKAFEAVAGYNPAFDIISVLATAFGFDDEEDSEDTVLDNVEQGFLELLEDLPYTSTFTGGRIPISSALPIEELVKGTDEYGNEKSRLETLGESLPYLFWPGGYSQYKKTKQGLSMFDDDLPVPGSYTDSGNLRFPVEDTFGSRLQAGIFGQWASENARDYFDNERKPLNEKQTQEYIDSEMSIDEYWEYREGLSGLSTLAEKADYIYDLDIPTWKKNLLINNIADRKEDIDMSDYGNYDSFAEFDFAMKNPEKYDFLTENGISYQEYVGADEDTKEAYNWAYKNPEEYRMWKAVGDDVTAFRQYAKDIYDLEADKDEEGNSIRGSRKEKVIDYVSNLDVDFGVKCILFKSEYPADDTYNADILDYLNSREDLTYDDIKTILTELGYTVYDDGTVEW